MFAHKFLTTAFGLLFLAAFFGCASIGEKPSSQGHPKRSPQFDKPGFETFLDGKKLWVFKMPSPYWSDFLRQGELVKKATWVGDGPEGMTVQAPDNETLYEYVGRRDGFKIFPQKGGTVWVFMDPSPELDKFEDFNRFDAKVEAAGAGVHASTLWAVDQATIDAYVRALDLPKFE